MPNSSSVIGIVESTKQIYEAAKDAKGLTKAFHEVGERLGMVTVILEGAKEFDEANMKLARQKIVLEYVETCQKRAKDLNDLFEKVLKKVDDGWKQRYIKAFKAAGKGSEVEALMRKLLDDVELLASEKGLRTSTEDQRRQLFEAVEELAALTPSVPELELQESGITAHNSGSGTQYNAHGEYIAQGEAKQYNTAGGTMQFGKD